MDVFFEKLLGTITLRWYTFAFLVTFVAHGLLFFKWKRVFVYTLSAYGLAWLCEFWSITKGFPFGLYHYIETTKDQELWIAGVPFFDSLSFVFLGYFSYLASRMWVGSGRYTLAHVLLGGLLMMLLDVIIDPVTLQGEKWFLGQIYYYPNPGPYFGVTLENFWGWFFLGTVLSLVAHFVFGPQCPTNKKLFSLSALGVYFGVVAFNLAIAFQIGETTMGWVGVFIMAPVLIHFLTRPKSSMLWR